jgi:hypothetical protein
VKKDTYKTAKTVKPYAVKYKGWNLEVPVGSIVSNQTAMGPDDSYRFWASWSGYVEELTGYKNSILAHDLKHYGLNIPAEFCEPYKPC